MIFWHLITKFGDSLILIPAAFTIAIWLIAGRALRLAAIWCILFGFAMLFVIATKVAFLGWGIGIESLDFTGFSGHAARAAAVIPVLFYLALQEPPRRAWSLSQIIGWLFCLVIVISRVKVHAHSISEVMTGFALGALVSTIFLWGVRAQSISLKRRWLLMPSLAILLAMPYTGAESVQQGITSFALYLSGHSRPFDRSMWRRYASYSPEGVVKTLSVGPND